MSEYEPTTTILYEKRTDGATTRCQVKVYSDNSAYICGEELEAVFEGSLEAVQDAIEYVESRGYVKAEPGQRHVV